MEVDFEEVVLDAPPPWAEPYVAASLPTPGTADIGHVRAAREIRQLLMTTVTEEAPIVEDLLIRRVIGAWGDVLSEKRRSIIRRHIDSLADGGSLVRHGNALCLPNQTVELVRVPDAQDPRTQREVKHVPDVELAEALVRLVGDARIVAEEEAKQRAARLFGWARNGPAIQAALTRVVEDLADEGRVTRDADGRLHA